MPPEAKAYAQIIALRKTLELISFEHKRCIEENMKEYEIDRAINLMGVPTTSVCPEY
ncbi:MAG: hypothetical protein ACRCSV_02180 [Chlamydiales bacterium]